MQCKLGRYEEGIYSLGVMNVVSKNTSPNMHNRTYLAMLPTCTKDPICFYNQCIHELAMVVGMALMGWFAKLIVMQRCEEALYNMNS